MSLPSTAWAALLAGTLLPLAAPACLRAEIKLPAIFGDHMVLQRDGATPVWGTASPGEAVTVIAGTAQETTTADADGKWKVSLRDLPASSQPIDVTVSGKNRITFHDVLVGDVWLCSGQSNMDFGIGNDASAAEEIPKADHPEIRLFTISRQALPAPAADLPAPPPGSTEGRWLVCTPETVRQNGWGGFSAVAYFFGLDISRVARSPVGLIAACWGATPAQAWTSTEGLQAAPPLKLYGQEAVYHRWNFAKQEEEYRNTILAKWKIDAEAWKAAHNDQWETYQAAFRKYEGDIQAAQDKGAPPPATAKPRDPGPAAPPDPAQSPGISSVLFNAMIAPVIPYGIKGATWYQGEANLLRPVEYNAMLPALIADWRGRWGRGEFPFLIVQLANCLPRQAAPSESSWAALREAQSKTAAMPHNGLAVAIDLGEPSDIHPKDKYDVGARLALAARRLAYGDDAVVSSGPTYSTAFAREGSLYVLFGNMGSGLVAGVPPPHFHPGEPRFPAPAIRGFAIAGLDGKFVWAEAQIAGIAVVLSSPQVPQPIWVRYDWADNPDGNLYNREGLPAVPFRTDNAPVGELLPKPAAPAPPAP